jgi:ribonuclease D
MITTESELKELTERAVNAPCVALDTEFFWERTFYPILGVVQVGFSESDCHLIDAVALPTLPHFGRMLTSRTTCKILHDAQQDLAILSRITNVTPCNIFDTRRAAGFTGIESTLSLANLLRKVLNVEIPKTETRSNWLKRPLTQKQIAYAVNDVSFLPELRELLISKADELGNGSYLTEEMQIFDKDDYYREPSPEDIFNRIKSGRLRGKSRNVMLELVRWREDAAHTRNIPRGHVLKNSDLITLAHYIPQNSNDIKNIQGLPRSASTHYSRRILDAVAKGCEAKQTAGSPRRQRLTPAIQQQIANRIESMQKKATAAGVDPALVAAKNAITDLVLSENSSQQLLFTENSETAPHPLLSGWRKNFL